jgi:hypothetical protein
MHLEVFVEEPSAKEVLDRILPKILGSEHSFEVHPFRDKQELLREIPKRLKAYAKWMPEDWRIVVLVDEDREDCRALKRRLVDAVAAAGLSGRVLCRIAVEELEAWFFGDVEALRAAYPKIPAGLHNRKKYRDPDAIAGGTWEVLDWLLRKHGYRAGLIKTDAARRIAEHMIPDRNRSHSFQVFRSGLERLVQSGP